MLGQGEPTPENYANAVKKLCRVLADQILKAYPGTTGDEVAQSATALAGDRSSASARGSGSICTAVPAALRPIATSTPGLGRRPRRRALRRGIENAPWATSASNKAYAWTPDDEKVSQTFRGSSANFVKTGNPNGAGLPKWPAANTGKTVPVMRIDVDSRAETQTGAIATCCSNRPTRSSDRRTTGTNLIAARGFRRWFVPDLIDRPPGRGGA